MEELKFSTELSGMSYRLIGPDAKPGDDGLFHVRREDGSVATLIQTPGSMLERSIFDLGAKRQFVGDLIQPLLSVRRMSRFTNASVLNIAVRAMSDEHCFVNVGVWNGFTMLAAIAGNDEKHCIGVDNFSEFGGPKEAFIERFTKRRSANHRFYDQDYVDYFAAGLDRPLGVYLYDGEHSFENQYRGLMVADPFYADDAVVVVDDTNLDRARDATLQFAEDSRLEWNVLYDQRTSGRRHPTLWNGLMVLQAGASKAKQLTFPVKDSIEDRLVAAGNKANSTVSVIALGNRKLPKLAEQGREVIPVKSCAGLRKALLESSTGGYALILSEDENPSSTGIAKSVKAAGDEAKRALARKG